MTWPFENDTSAIIKKLANRSMKTDKTKQSLSASHDCPFCLHDFFDSF